MIATPFWITNFKNYESAVGDNAVRLALIHQKVAQDTGASIGIAVSALDLYRVRQAVSIPVFAQHIDAIGYGSSTGKILPHNVKNAGGIGTLINHSERRIDTFENLSQINLAAQNAQLISIVCAENPEEVGKVSVLNPDFIAFEPPELIGSSTKSVSSEKPESITQSILKAQGVPLLVGAGINSVRDIEVALSLGAKGFLVASAITKSANPEKALREFIAAF